PTALAAADKALQIQPGLPEALFNRALILEHLGLLADARNAWQVYLQADPSSTWATEARSRIAQLPTLTLSTQFERERPLLEAAALRGDSIRVTNYVDAHRERSRGYAEAIYLGHWGEAVVRNDPSDASRWLSISRAIGDALIAISGDALLRDAVRAIDRASPEQRLAIGAAHADYLRGRIEHRDGQRDAELDLLHAAAKFETVNDPMSLQARHYAASARLRRNDAAGAREDLERLLKMVNAHADYISLGGLVRWELGRSMYYDNDWSAAAVTLDEGAALFRRTGESGNEGMIEMTRAYALTSLGHNDAAWLARTQAFSALSEDGDTVRLASCVAVAASAELVAGHRDAALALSATEASMAQVSARPDTAISGLINLAQLQSMNGDSITAMKTVRRARELAQNVADPGMRANWNAHVDVATGAVLAESSPRAATEMLSRTIDFYTTHAMTGALLDPLLLRSRCAVREGDAASAMRDLERAMNIVESHPSDMPGAAAGWSVLDAEHAVFTDAIRLSLDRGDKAAAFAFAERSHGTQTTVPELERRLAGTRTVVLEFAALPDDLITFAVAENDIVVLRQRASVESLGSLAEESLSEAGTVAAAKLYAALIRPAEDILARANEVVIVADQRFSTIPFAALYDTVHHRFLVERFAVSVAASAGSLQPDAMRTAAPAVAAIALPTGDADTTVGLPDAEREVRELAGLYARTTPISTTATFEQFRTASVGADVVHIAGHTERELGGGEQALLFEGASGKAERVTWKTIVGSAKLHDSVVVLAACETLRPPPSTGTHALSLGGAFLAAGAGDVIGTLTPIGDRDGRLLFEALHRRLASGERPAEALRAVQLNAIHSEESGGGRRAWRAIALLSRRIPAPPRRKELFSWVN
ncbi:MAG TPA: CHAT domain-containing protein, partial [Thermoanaerobaculia bacterium]|nr:CHAT domain-containing protein [Thermoanaerobaculia bacterium]